MQLCNREDGIYFAMPEAEYHKLPRMSASGVKNMAISPATFWSRSWMNPSQDDGDTPARIIGRAYHAARLEPETFLERYARELTKDDMPEGAFLNDADIKAELKERGEPQSRTGESVGDRAERLVALGVSPAMIWHTALAAYEADTDGMQIIPASAWDDIQTDAERLRSMPEVARHIEGGFAEVTVLWTDEETGVQFKARLDYLRPSGVTDLKTFDNSRGKHLRQAITDAFRFNGYWIQAAIYWRAAERIRLGELDVIQGSDEERHLVNLLRKREDPLELWHVWQEKGGVPNVLATRYTPLKLHASLEAAAPDDNARDRVARKYGGPTLLQEKAEAATSYACRTFKFYREVFGVKPWLPVDPISTISDDDFNLNWLESDW